MPVSKRDRKAAEAAVQAQSASTVETETVDRDEHGLMNTGIDVSRYDRLSRDLSSLSAPVRLAILSLLLEAPRSVGALVVLTGEPQANISNHLARMRDRTVEPRRDGRNVIYHLTEKGKQFATMIRECMNE